MSLSVRQAVIDCANARWLARFWAATLNYDFSRDDEGAVVLHDPTGRDLPIEFQQVPAAKAVVPPAPYPNNREGRTHVL